jgi:hypothetical protein
MTAPEKRALRATQEIARRIMENPKRRMAIIQEYYSELVEAGDTFGAAVVLTLMPIAQERGEMKPEVPKWFPIAGFGSGILTLLFFMSLVIASVFDKQVPVGSRFLVVVVVALGAGLSSSFLGGAAVASGKVPVFKNSPLKFSVGGGIAVFIIVLAVGKYLYT